MRKLLVPHQKYVTPLTIRPCDMTGKRDRVDDNEDSEPGPVPGFKENIDLGDSIGWGADDGSGSLHHIASSSQISVSFRTQPTLLGQGSPTRGSLRPSRLQRCVIGVESMRKGLGPERGVQCVITSCSSILRKDITNGSAEVEEDGGE